MINPKKNPLNTNFINIIIIIICTRLENSDFIKDKHSQKSFISNSKTKKK